MILIYNYKLEIIEITRKKEVVQKFQNCEKEYLLIIHTQMKAESLRQTTLDNFYVRHFKVKEEKKITVMESKKVRKTVQTCINGYFKVNKMLQSVVAVGSEIQSMAKKFGSCQIPYYFRVLNDHNEW